MVLTRHKFTADEYEVISASGIFKEDDHIELIDGEIIEMSPIGIRHMSCVNRLTNILKRKVGETAIVSVQNPIRLGAHSEPEPDIVLLRPKENFYADAYPTLHDIFLVIEVADTSAAYDREVKLPMYAEAGIIEVWLVNLNDEAIEVCREPRNGFYEQRQVMRHGETLSLLSLTLTMEMKEILG
ncbi:MAG: Uma2 family endonuclease [Rhizobacter sp.]|nr:Uma2 family endonuclease [Chlorobiales bacterium]